MGHLGSNEEFYLLLKTLAVCVVKVCLSMLASSAFGKRECSWAKKWAWRLWRLTWLRVMGLFYPAEKVTNLETGGFSVFISLLKTTHRKGYFSCFTWCMDFIPMEIKEGTCS